MRRAAKIDANQPAIVQALRAAGASVLCMHSLGGGAPDLVVGFRGRNYLLEVKDGDKYPSERRLTQDESRFFQEWRGEVTVVNDVEEALEVVGATRKD